MNYDFAEIYSDSCTHQQTWVRQILKSTPFCSENYDRIIDAGCGTGEVTNILLERFPNAKEIYAFDKAPEMIKVARERNSHPKINYSVGSVDDVESLCSVQVSTKPRGFNLFTSFFALHWVQDQSKALPTVQATLAPGGEFLLVLQSEIPLPFMKIGPTVAKMSKWAGYLANFTQESPLSSDWEINKEWKTEPVSGYKKLCEDADMVVISSKLFQDIYRFSDDDQFMSVVKSVLPQVRFIPQERVQEFMADVLEVFTKYSDRDEQGRLRYSCDILCVHGFKRSSNVPDRPTMCPKQ